MGKGQKDRTSTFEQWKHRARRAFRSIPALSPGAAYDLWAPTYGESQNNIFLQAELQGMSALMDELEWSGTTVLDAGCGTGRYFPYCLQRGARQIIGLDLSRGMLLTAKRASWQNGISLVEGSVDLLPLRDGSLDIVLVPLVLGHVKSLKHAAQELTRVLRCGGTLMVSDWHPENEGRGWKRTFEVRSPSLPVQQYAVKHHAHTVEDYVDNFTEAGCVLQRRVEPLIDDSMRPAFERNNMLSVYRKHYGSPLVLLLKFRKS